MKRVPVRSYVQYLDLNNKELCRGRFYGWAGKPEPGDEHSYSFWIGWREGMVQAGRMEKDDAQIQLDWERQLYEAQVGGGLG